MGGLTGPLARGSVGDKLPAEFAGWVLISIFGDAFCVGLGSSLGDVVVVWLVLAFSRSSVYNLLAIIGLLEGLPRASLGDKLFVGCSVFSVSFSGSRSSLYRLNVITGLFLPLLSPSFGERPFVGWSVFVLSLLG